MINNNKTDNSNKIILDLCGGTGSWAKPYADAGYNVITITLPDYDVTDVVFSDDYMVFNKQTYNVNDLGIKYEDVYGILAAPHITINACLKIIEKCKPKFWALENPV